jgi:hypothetical protein
MTSPTLRSGPRASSGRMCSRIHGPPTSGGDPVRVLGGCEFEDQHEVCVVDSDDSRGRRAGVPDARHNVAARLLGLRGERVAQVQMIYHDRHRATV